MTAVETLQTAIEVLFLVIAIATCWRWRRGGGRPAGWVAAAFGALALVVVAGWLGVEDGPPARAAQALLLTFPYLLFRFAASFRPLPRRLDVAVGAAAAVVVAWSLLVPETPRGADLPAAAVPFLVAALAYWSVVSVVVAVRLWRAGSGHAGVTRWRMRLLGVASLLLNAAILASGAVPGEESAAIALGIQLTLVLSGLLFLTGFVAPRPLRALYGRTAVEELRRGARQLVGATRPDEVLDHLLPQVTALVGGSAAAVIDREGRVVRAHGDAGATAGPTVDVPLSTGSLRVWSSPYTPYFGDEEVEIVGFLGALADLALERTRAGERAAWLASVVDSSDDAIIGMRTDGSIVSWNTGAQHLFGYTADEVVGRPATLLVPPGLPDDLGTALLRLGDGDTTQHRETRRLRRDGTQVDVSLTRSAIRDATGTVTGASAIVRDITQRRRLEAELATARDQAVEGTRLKSEFLAMMSHEIRTPMNGVIGMTSLLLGTGLTAEQREYAETIRRSGDALLAVINDILDLSKIEAGKLTLEVVDFDPRAALEEAVDLLAEHADAKGVELAVLVEPDVPPAVSGDRDRLRQILVNLVGNAVKFTHEGEVVVRAGVAERDGDGLVLRVEVTDTGIGIAPAAQAGLFESFTQVNTSTTRAYGGTGLGLAISKRLTQLLGGEIGVDSELGKGSTFWFTARLGAAQPPAEEPGRDDAVDLSGLRVLVVDDNATNRRILSLTLASWGLRPAGAADAHQGLSMLQAAAATDQPYALVLLDLLMPGTDGIQLAGAIRADAGLPPVPLVLLTSTGHRPDPATTRAAGITATLAKPVRHSALHDCLVTVMDGHTGQVRAAATDGAATDARARFPAHVLVVEDNAVNQKVAARMLERLGHRVDVAGNGVEAVTAVRQIAYDAVLMDCQMPEMDGYQATRHIREMDGRDGLPIVAMTAAAMQTDRERCIAAGMDDFLAKPVRLEELRDILDHWLGLARTAAEPPLDPEVLDGLRRLETGRGGDLVHELAGLFLDGAGRSVAELRAALESGDLPAAARAAHAVKGSSATIGADALARLAGRLEQEAGAGDLAAARVRVDQLDGELARVRAALPARRV